jgi:glyoxylase-like metal-dependent hydrolase (beta-lactamase superfamily II)
MLQPNVVDGIHRIEDAYTNWYLVEGEDGITIVDAGVPTSWTSFRSALSQIGRSVDDVRAIVLTHAHFDHIGFAEKARRELRVPVYVHENDVPLTRKPMQYTRERPASLYIATHPAAWPIAASLVRNRAFFPPPIHEVTRFQGGTLPVPGSPRVIPAPGHTVGHCALHLADRDVLIAGDAIVTLDPYTGKTGPRLVARAATGDSPRALGSLDALLETGAQTVFVGHGVPWTDGVESAVARARAVGVP